MKAPRGLLGMAAGLLIWAYAHCETRYVSPNGSNEAPYLTRESAATSIQSAMAVASPGDTVSVAAGDYREHIVMGAPVMLAGSGAEATRIVGSVVASPDSEIRELALVQEVPEEDPDYARVAIAGPSTGGLIVVGCSVSGTYETGVRCGMDAGYALILDCEIRGMRTAPGGDAIAIWQPWGGRPLVCVVDGCVLEDNNTAVSAASRGGVWVMRTELFGNGTAVYVARDAVVLACSLDNNGAGVVVYDGAVASIESSTITRSRDVAVRCQDSSQVELTNCTITDNVLGLSMGYIERVEARSCIIWENNLDVNSYAVLSPGVFDVRYSDLGPAPDYAYVHEEDSPYGNIDGDPLFVNPEAGNYRLRPESPCIDTGSDGAYYADQLHTAYDLDGKRRFVYGGKAYEVDMGAYEYHINRLTPGPVAGQVTLTWSSRHRTDYSVFYSEDLITWHPAQDLSTGLYDYTTTSWTDDGSLTGIPPLLAPKRFYRILENP